jgi:hypothetical protein
MARAARKVVISLFSCIFSAFFFPIKSAAQCPAGYTPYLNTRPATGALHVAECLNPQTGLIVFLDNISSAAAGAWDNSSNHQPNSLTLGGFNFATYLGTVHFTDALSVGMETPAGAAVLNSNAVAGYAQSNCNSHSATVCNTVAGYFSASANANNAAVWGSNPVVGDVSGLTGDWLIGEEVDVNVHGTPTNLNGIILELAGDGTMPTGAVGIDVNNYANSGAPLNWGASFRAGVGSPATATANLFPGAYQIQSQIWDGAESASDIVQFYAYGGNGANPVMTYVWNHPSGTSGATHWGVQTPLDFTFYGNNGHLTSFVPTSAAPSANAIVSVPVNTNGNLGLNGQSTGGGYYVAVKGTAGCTTGGSQGNACGTAITVTWPTSFADTNYTAVCSPSGANTNYPSSPYVASKAAGSMTVNYVAMTAAAAKWATVDCVAIHD